MIPSLLALLGSALAQSEPPADDPTETPADPLAPYRTPFTDLANRTIGTASKPVAFNWRATTVQIAALGSFPFELNNFNNLRAGGLVRVPSGKALVEVSVAWAQVWDSPSSRLLALTPYRQPGRPSRIELDLGVAYPLAEGVVTAMPRFFPAAQLVFNAHLDFRYLIHPTGWGNMRPRQVIGAIFAPGLSEIEVDNLEGARLDAMQVDTGRYGLMVGLGNDIYFEQGLFLSPRALISVPILAPITGTELGWWAEFSLAVGVAL